MFKSRPFADYATTNLVLVQVDFPRTKTQPEALKKANRALMQRFRVEGFPTLVVLNSAGKKVGEEVGYDGSGPQAIIAKLDGFKAK